MGRKNLREQLLEHGQDLVHKSSFADTGVAEIALAAQAPKGSFYNHFKSKDDFGRAIVMRYFVEAKAALSETLGDSTFPAGERLQRYFLRLRNYNAKSSFARGCLIGNISAESPAVSLETRTAVAQVFSHWSSTIAACVKEGQNDGSIGSDLKPEILARLLLDAWQGGLLRAKIERSPDSPDEFLTITLPALLNARR